jgi:transcriptional regulator with XRE-family HTH domain
MRPCISIGAPLVSYCVTIGERIEERRKALAIKSQSELARRAEMKQSTLSGIIRRPYRWSPHLPRLARELQTTVDYLVGDIDDPDESAPPPPPAPTFQFVTLQVALPSEPALARMFEGLLRTLDRSRPLDEQALLLAQRLPIGLSQLRDLIPTPPMPAAAAAPPAALAMPDPELR